MYMDIPKSCRFGGCKLYFDCPNEKHQFSGTNEPCDKAVECFGYLDKYNGNEDLWADLHEMED